MKLSHLNVFIVIIWATTSTTALAQTWSLNQCLDSALVNNTKLELVNNSVKLTELKNQEVKSNLIPKVNVNGEYKYFIELPYQLMPLSIFGGPEGQFQEAQFGVPHNINANLSIQAPLFSSELYGAIKKTELGKQLVELQVLKTEDEVFYEVSSLYRNAQLIQNQIFFLDSLISNTKGIQKNMILLNEEQLTTKTDSKKIELQISLLISQKLNLEMKLKQVLNGLKIMMGLNTDSELLIDPIISLIPFQVYEQNGNTDYDLLQVQENILNVEMTTLNRSRFLPDVGIVGSYGVQGYGYDQSPNEFLNFYPIGFVGLRLSYPIFNGTTTNKKIDQKKIELENIELKKKSTLDANNLAIENALVVLKNAFALFEISKSQVELSQLILTEETYRYEEGLSSINDVLQSQNELIKSKQNYLQSLAECLSADLILRKLTNNFNKE